MEVGGNEWVVCTCRGRVLDKNSNYVTLEVTSLEEPYPKDLKKGQAVSFVFSTNIDSEIPELKVKEKVSVSFFNSKDKAGAYRIQALNKYLE